MKILGIIPARYASTRFPAKPLANIAGQSMIERTYKQVQKTKLVTQVVVATDHTAIFEHVQAFGGNVVMTDPNHPSGTDRCREAYQTFGSDADFVINIQGDEPFIAPGQIDLLAQLLGDKRPELATLIAPLTDPHELHNPNTVKVVKAQDGKALYFSRHALPFLRGQEPHTWLTYQRYYKHIGIYGYRTDILEAITRLTPSALEQAESLEQLRWLENGYSIYTAETPYSSMGIDTPEDLNRALAWLAQQPGLH